MSNPVIPTLSEDAAQKLLENVFTACEKQPNTVPLSALESYSEYMREKFSLQKIILIVVLVIFLALPACFIAPKFTVTKISEDDARLPKYEIVVKGKFPIWRVNAEIDGHNITVYETGQRTYTVEPTINGVMNVRVNLINRQYNDETVIVSGIDNDSPYLVSDWKSGDFLYVKVADDGLGINFDGIYAETLSGSIIKPYSYDQTSGDIVFYIPDESLNIYIPDVNDNVLQLVLTV